MRASWIKTWMAVALLVALPAVLCAQLPPEFQMDRYLSRAERQIAERNFVDAMESLDRVLEVQTKHSIEVPDGFSFTHAQVSLALGFYAEAIKSVTEYLTETGREGTHYSEALQLFNTAEAEIAAAREAVEEEKRRFEGSRRRAEAMKAVAEEARKRAETVIAGIEFVWVPPGQFRMGSTSAEADDDERPRRRIRISNGFYLGKYKVTQELWQAVMGTSPAHFSGCLRCPVESVSWHDAQAFIAKLNGRSGRNLYRLPTEAEWEYAARAGMVGDRYAASLDAVAWHEDNSDGRTHPVGQKAPNAWGLYGMLGNVHEWVQDWYGPYSGGRMTDPQGPRIGEDELRVYRGCGWRSGGMDDKYDKDCRLSSRLSYAVVWGPDRTSSDIGFRIVKKVL